MNKHIYSTLKFLAFQKCKIISFVCKIPFFGELIKKASYSNHLSFKRKKINKATVVNQRVISICFITDIHWGANIKKSPEMMRILFERCNIDALVFGGDFITHSDFDKNAMIELGLDFFNQIKFANDRLCCVVGNHDDNSYQQANHDSILNEYEIKNVLFSNPYFLKCKDCYKFNYYVDFPKNKCRLLFLDTSNRKVDKSQFDYIVKILNSTQEGWQIIALAHIWLEWNPTTIHYEANCQTKEIIKIFDCFNLRTNTEHDFSNAKGNVSLMIGGHIHKDYKAYSEGGYLSFCVTQMLMGKPAIDYILPF